jgi:hypothetical protein
MVKSLIANRHYFVSHLMKAKPVCQEILAWLKANLGPHCLAPLTSTDARALSAAVHILELYNCCDSGHEAAILQAFAAVVRQMQSTTQHLAYHAIAQGMNWSDRERLWLVAGLDPGNFGVCKYEPRQREAMPV